MNRSKYTQVLAVLVMMSGLLLGACSSAPDDLKAAPLGERAVLESLAESFTAISDERLSVSPMSMTGEDRKKFVVQVFARSGYSYEMTLTKMAKEGVDVRNQLHVDMAELLLMPHRSSRFPVELTDLYSSAELQAIAVVERQLNM